MSFHENAIFWIDVDKISPNPYQPRREFDEGRLQDLADSIRQYGVLQPLVVTRKEILKEDGNMVVEYELIAGERRLRASKIAGVSQVPAVIRRGDEDGRVKLELAIIENLQREDLNPVERAQAFAKLAKEFSYKHSDIARKIGRSREYVSNCIRLLALPEEMITALSEGKISEGHTRPLLMLCDRPEEQQTLFKEIVFRKMTVRDAEHISRRIAYDKVRKFAGIRDDVRPDIIEFEEEASQMFGRRVQVRKGKEGGKVVIDFMSEDDLKAIMDILRQRRESVPRMEESHIGASSAHGTEPVYEAERAHSAPPHADSSDEPNAQIEDKTDDDDVFSLGSFSI